MRKYFHPRKSSPDQLSKTSAVDIKQQGGRMSESNWGVSPQIETIAKELRSAKSSFNKEALATRLDNLAKPRGGIELAFVCSECGVMFEAEEVESEEHEACTNCGQPFYEV